jgi:hypothetical protein
MNARTLFSTFATAATAFVAIAGAASAFAGEPTQLSRADVRAAAVQALGAGQVIGGHNTGESTTPFVSTLKRADVRTAAIQARDAGLIVSGHNTGESTLPFMSVLARQQVAAEGAEAVRVGAVGQGEFGTMAGQSLNGPTMAQLESIRMAGQRALPTRVAMR